MAGGGGGGFTRSDSVTSRIPAGRRAACASRARCAASRASSALRATRYSGTAPGRCAAAVAGRAPLPPLPVRAAGELVEEAGRALCGRAGGLPWMRGDAREVKGMPHGVKRTAKRLVVSNGRAAGSPGLEAGRLPPHGALC